MDFFKKKMKEFLDDDDKDKKDQHGGNGKSDERPIGF
jgi:hypothetical protein